MQGLEAKSVDDGDNVVKDGLFRSVPEIEGSGSGAPMKSIIFFKYFNKLWKFPIQRAFD